MARSCFYQAAAINLYNAFSLMDEQNEIIVISDDDDEPQPSTSGVNGVQNVHDECIIIEDDDHPLVVVVGGSRPQNEDPQPSTSADYVGGCEYDMWLFKLFATSLSVEYYQLEIYQFANTVIFSSAVKRPSEDPVPSTSSAP